MATTNAKHWTTCDSAKIDFVRNQYNTCTTKIRTNFLPSTIYQTKHVTVTDVCRMIDETVFDCGKVYEKCYDEEGMK